MSFRAILFGTAMLSSVRALRLLAQLVTVPILARLLLPEQYGIVAIAMPVALFAMMIADAGIGASLVRTPASERTTWSTCFWLSILLGIILTSIMALMGPVVAAIFKQPALTPMILVLALVVLLQTIHLIPVAALQQAGRFRTIALVELSAVLTGMVAAVYVAYHGGGAWALIAQQVVFFAVRVSCCCLFSPFRPRWVFDRHQVIEHLHFGRNVLGNSLVTYLSRTFDNLIVGKVLGAGLLGIYTMAFQFARLPSSLVAGPLQYVLYAQLVKLKNNPIAIGDVFLTITRLLTLVILPVMGMIAIAHAPIFGMLLSPKWAHVGLVFMIVAPAAAFQAITTIGEPVCYALNRPDLQLRTAFKFSLLWLTTLSVSVSFGLVYAAMAFSASVFLYQFYYVSQILPLLKCRLYDYLKIYPLPLLLTASALALYSLISHYALRPEGDDWLRIALSAVLAATAIGIGFLLQKEMLLREIRALNRAADTALPPPVELEGLEAAQ